MFKCSKLLLFFKKNQVNMVKNVKTIYRNWFLVYLTVNAFDPKNATTLVHVELHPHGIAPIF